jgi:hypothetical protein
MKPDDKNEDAWAVILAHGAVVVAAYNNLLEASDNLAKNIERYSEDVLSQVMPRRAGERRESDRILDWLEHYRDDIESHLAQRRTEREAAKKRAALLASLNLTDAQKRLLGIEV